MFDPPGSLLELDTVKLHASLGQTLQQPFLLGGSNSIAPPSSPRDSSLSSVTRYSHSASPICFEQHLLEGCTSLSPHMLTELVSPCGSVRN